MDFIPLLEGLWVVAVVGVGGGKSSVNQSFDHRQSLGYNFTQ